MKMIKKYFGDLAFLKVMLKIAIPIALQNLLSSSLALVDTLMVGQLGDITLSSVGMAGQFSWFMSMVMFGLVSGLSTFVAQYHGVGDNRSIKKVYGMALIFGVSVSFLFMTLGFLFPSQILTVFNRDPEVIRIGSEYLSVAVFSYIALALNYVFMSVLRSTERVKLPLFATLATTLANCFLNYALIFGKFGFPSYGAKGAAIATVISSWISPAIILIVSLIQKNILIATPKEMFGFDKELFVRFLKRAYPVILNETLWGSGTVIFNIIFSNLGAGNYAAVTILRTFESIAFVFFVGLCSASSVIVGKSTGCGDIKSAVRDAKRFTVLVPLLSLFIGIIMIIFRAPIVGLFDMDGKITAETLEIAKTILCIYAIEIPIRNIPYILICGVFRPGGETRKGMRYDLIFLWAVSLPITLLTAFVFRLPFPTVFAITYISEDWLKAIFCIRYFISDRWLKPVTKEGKEAALQYKLNKAKSKVDV